MISKNIKIGTTVFHEVFGFGIFKGYEKNGKFKGYADVVFNDLAGISLISRRKLTEIEE